MDITKLRLSQNIQCQKEKPRVSESNRDIDVVSYAIREYGRWQIHLLFLLALFSFPSTFQIYLPTFTAQSTKFWCRRPDHLSNLPIESWVNCSQPYGSCSVRANVTVQCSLNTGNTAPLEDIFQSCTSWEYDDSESITTIITEWDLVCDRSRLVNIAEVVFLLGIGLGSVTGGWISDRFGRKPTLMGMVLIQSILAIASYFVQSYVQYAVIRSFMGLVSVSVVFTTFVLAVELVGGNWVVIAGMCLFLPLPLSYILVSVVSMYVPNWRTLQLVLSLPGCLLLLMWFYLPESPRWYLSVGKIEEAKAVLKKAAKFNNMELPSDLDSYLIPQKSDNKDDKVSILLIFKRPFLIQTPALLIVWFTMTVGYYGLLLNTKNLNLGNLHITSIVLAVVEIPAILLSALLLFRFGKRKLIIITMTICGLACVASIFLSITVQIPWVITATLMIGKFAIGATNMMLPIYTAEVYPILLRNLGVGATQASAGLALITIPYLWNAAVYYEQTPMIIIGTLCLIGAAVVLLLAEKTT